VVAVLIMLSVLATACSPQTIVVTKEVEKVIAQEEEDGYLEMDSFDYGYRVIWLAGFTNKCYGSRIG